MTAKDLYGLGIIDAIVKEPLGGAHRDHHQMAAQLKSYLRTSLRELVGLPIDRLLESRYQKFRRMGVFTEGVSPEAPAASVSAAADSPDGQAADAETDSRPLSPGLDAPTRRE